MIETILATMAYLMIGFIGLLVFGCAAYWVVAKMLDLEGDE